MLRAMRTRSLRVTGLVVLLAAVLASLVLGTALGAQAGPRLTVVPASGRAGQAVVVRGYGFRPGARGFVVIGGKRAASFLAGARGRFRVGLIVPAGVHGRLRILAARSVRTKHGSRRLGLAGTRFQVLAPSVDGGPLGVAPGGAAAGSIAAGPAAGSGASTGGSTGASGTGAPAPKEAPKETPKEAPKEAPKGKEAPKEVLKEEPPKKGKEAPKEAPKEEPKGKEAPKEEPKSGRWAPPEHLTWYWQLQGTVTNSEPVAAYDIDGFENTAIEVASLHSKSIHVICYIDVGTYEPGRPDTSSFPASVIGAEVQGWPGERWLDVRQLSVLE